MHKTAILMKHVELIACGSANVASFKERQYLNWARCTVISKVGLLLYYNSEHINNVGKLYC